MNVLEVQGLTTRCPAYTLNGVAFGVPKVWSTRMRGR